MSHHAVREAWNSEVLERHCPTKGLLRYIVRFVPAEDFLKNGETIPDQVRLEIATLNEKKTNRLQERIEIAIGMKMMVLLNLSTEADIANGTTGTIEDILLDPREENCTVDENGAALLKYPPALIIFKPDGDKDLSLQFPDQFAGHSRTIPKNTVPLMPSSTSFTIHTSNGQKYTIYRRQTSLTISRE